MQEEGSQTPYVRLSPRAAWATATIVTFVLGTALLGVAAYFAVTLFQCLMSRGPAVICSSPATFFGILVFVCVMLAIGVVSCCVGFRKLTSSNSETEI